MPSKRKKTEVAPGVAVVAIPPELLDQLVNGPMTPEEVRADTKRRIEDLAPGGGFVFATVHNIQGNVPAENILAMWETLQEYGVY